MDLPTVKDEHGNSFLEVIYSLYTKSDIAATSADITYLINLMYSIGVTDGGSEKPAHPTWYSLCQGNPVAESLVNWSDSG